MIQQANSPALDRRLHAFRADLADVRLDGRVEAERFVDGVAARTQLPVAPVRQYPADIAPLDTEALFGEAVRVFERRQG